MVQQEETTEARHNAFKDHVWQIKVNNLTLIPEFSDCSVLGFATVRSSGLALSPLVICSATPVMRSYDFARYEAVRLKFSVLGFCPRMVLFGEHGNQCFKWLLRSQDKLLAFPELRLRKKLSFLGLKHYFKKKSRSCSNL